MVSAKFVVYQLQLTVYRLPFTTKKLFCNKSTENIITNRTRGKGDTTSVVAVFLGNYLSHSKNTQKKEKLLIGSFSSLFNRRFRHYSFGGFSLISLNLSPTRNIKSAFFPSKRATTRFVCSGKLSKNRVFCRFAPAGLSVEGIST
jgi:hypothetical protein